MIPYRVKHKPTGLYYQPVRHRGSHLSKKGKVYLGKSNGIFSDGSNIIRVVCQKDSVIYKSTKDKLIWLDRKWAYNGLYADTSIEDWEIEFIK